MRFLVLGLLLCCGAARAEFYSGNDVLAKMQGTQAEQMVALGYVAGVSDALQKAVHCAPMHVTTGQVRDLFQQYLLSRPDQRHFSADSILSNVLRATWPCKKGTSL